MPITAIALLRLWDMACSLSLEPLARFVTGGAGARPDHPIRWVNRPASLWIAEDFGAALQADGDRVNGLKHQKEKRSMDYFAGLDVSVKETRVCIVNGTGKIIREGGFLNQRMAGAVPKIQLRIEVSAAASGKAAASPLSSAMSSQRLMRFPMVR